MRRIYHGACGKWWTGDKYGHCGLCHETFTSDAFDRHQTLQGGHVTCSVELLEAVSKPWGSLWRYPKTEKRQASLDALKDER